MAAPRPSRRRRHGEKTTTNKNKAKESTKSKKKKKDNALPPYNILPYHRYRARKLGVRIRPSERPQKKIDVFTKDNRRLASIGDRQYKDFILHMKEKGPEYARRRRRNYRKRHAGHRRKVGTPSYFADQILWGNTKAEDDALA